MGMFDSLYDKDRTEWQTKAFGCVLASYQLGDALPGPPIDYQLDICGGPHGAYEDSHATIRGGILEALDVPRDHSLPFMDYHGGWPPDQQPPH